MPDELSGWRRTWSVDKKWCLKRKNDCLRDKQVALCCECLLDELWLKFGVDLKDAPGYFCMCRRGERDLNRAI